MKEITSKHSNKHMTMKQLPKLDRPYEKLRTNGPEYLSDAELLAIILRSGSKEERSVEVAQRLLKSEDCNEDISKLYDFSLEELQKINGIGPVKAIQIKAVLELSKRITKTEAQKKLNVFKPNSVADLYMEQMRYLKQEHFKVVYLNTRYDIIKDKDISIGSVDATVVLPREVFKEAIKIGTSNIILIHNHTSGYPSPSKNDIEITKKIIFSGKLIGINVIDHIIIGDGEYFSMKNAELI